MFQQDNIKHHLPTSPSSEQRNRAVHVNWEVSWNNLREEVIDSDK